jgi:phage shock protein PspC (stress-responsive transcriptional regulator)
VRAPGQRIGFGPRGIDPRRSRDDRWLGGVCGGIAQVTDVAAWVWRLMFAVLVLCGGTGLLVYLLMWLRVPQEAPAGGRPTGTPVHS